MTHVSFLPSDLGESLEKSVHALGFLPNELLDSWTHSRVFGIGTQLPSRHKELAR